MTRLPGDWCSPVAPEAGWAGVLRLGGGLVHWTPTPTSPLSFSGRYISALNLYGILVTPACYFFLKLNLKNITYVTRSVIIY